MTDVRLKYLPIVGGKHVCPIACPEAGEAAGGAEN
jgi:hypothetical protein